MITKDYKTFILKMKGILKMKKNIILVAVILTFSIVLTGCGHTHAWESATCTTPKTCVDCGETEGEVLEHEWIEATCTVPKTCSVCGETEGKTLDHEWIEATCQEAEHCLLCGVIQGEPIEHSWNDATCVEAKTCSSCKLTDGEALGHTINDWMVIKETSCAEEGERAGICERCSKECKENIEKLPHTQSDWQVKEDYIFNPDGTVKAGTEEIVCTVCEVEIETREYTVELTLSQKNAVICAYDEISFWHCGPDFLIYTCLVEFESYPIEDAKFAVAHMDIDWDEQAVLYARENCEGKSKAGLIGEMRHYGFNNDQIEKALKEIGY